MKSLEKCCHWSGFFPSIGDKAYKVNFVTEISPRTSLGRNDKADFWYGFRQAERENAVNFSAKNAADIATAQRLCYNGEKRRVGYGKGRKDRENRGKDG